MIGWTAVAMALIVFEKGPVQRVFRRLLEVIADAREHPVAGLIGLFSIALDHITSGHLCHVRSAEFNPPTVQTRRIRGLEGLLIGFCGDVSPLPHTPKHVIAPFYR